MREFLLRFFCLGSRPEPLLSAQDNMRGAPYNGYTGETFDTTHYAYDYLVDSSLQQDDPAQKKFKTVQAAYAAAPAGTADHPTVIGIKPDVYFLRGGETEASMTITKNYITLLGLTDDRRKVVLADNRGNKEGASNNGYILMVNATGFTMMNLTLVNYCNLDYEYPGDPSKNLKMRSPVITQAVALQADGDKHVYSHVALLSRLDTTFIRTTRSYFTHVYIEGTDDFIGGGTGGRVGRLRSLFPHRQRRHVFLGNRLHQHRLQGRARPRVLQGISQSCRAHPLHHAGEYSQIARGVDGVESCRAAERLRAHLSNQRRQPGNPPSSTTASSGRTRLRFRAKLPRRKRKAFNPWNMLRATPDGKVDDWDPAGVRAKYENDGSDVFRMALAGSQSPAPSRPRRRQSAIPLPTRSRRATRPSAPAARTSRSPRPFSRSARPTPQSIGPPIQNCHPQLRHRQIHHRHRPATPPIAPNM